MKHAREVIELLSPYPGRRFKMIEIVRYVCGSSRPSPKEWERLRKGIRRVLDELEEMGSVARDNPGRAGGYATYQWQQSPLCSDNSTRSKSSGSALV
jgi:hypothetical protein